MFWACANELNGYRSSHFGGRLQGGRRHCRLQALLGMMHARQYRQGAQGAQSSETNAKPKHP